ncbi:MAG TPA: Gfo/Idh/MocA family oxidoreductase, partial [Vicinamibacterales bacterium]
MPSPLRIAFLGCGFITRVHSRNLRRFKSEIVCGYASRDKVKAQKICDEYRGTGSYKDYSDAINDPNIDAVVVAVP